MTIRISASWSRRRDARSGVRLRAAARSEGAFQFATAGVEDGDEIDMTTDHLLMEGARPFDEATHR